MTVQNDDERFETDTAADADLILRTRSGDGDAFGELWRRHYPSGMAVARSVTSSIEPDDLVQESYTRIYQAILKGGGPNGSFRAYLFTSIRNTAAAWGRARRETAMDELETVPDPDSTDQATNEALDRGLTAHAFRSLPTRWQEVLWYTEIEQMKPARIAPLLGMKPGGISQLAFRAREGLREAWIQAHLRSTSSDSECHWSIERLGAYSRGNLSARDQKRIDQHLEGCARCVIVAGEAEEVSSRLALILLPLVLGLSGAAGYTAALQSGSVPVAVAAMPSSVIAGGAVVNGAGIPIGGLVTGVPGAPDAGAGSAGGAGASGGAITGIGALVGAGSVALVVAGVVAAAVIVPGLVDASPVTSLPSAGDADSSSISSEVSPDGAIESDEKLVLEMPDDAPKKDAPKKGDVDEVPGTDAPAPDAPPIAETTPAAPAPGTSDDDDADGEGGVGTGPTQPPVDPTEPTDPPVDPTEPTDPPVDPTEPTDPPVDPGDPGDEGDEGETAVPTGPVTIADTSIKRDDSGWRHYILTITVDGVPGTTVETLLGDSAATDPVVLDGQGSGDVVLRLPVTQSVRTVVTIQYLTDDGAQYPLRTPLWKLGFTALTSSAAVPPDEEPVLEAPVTDESVVEEPVPEDPVLEEPPVVEPPVVEPPVVEPPVVEPPVVQAPAEDPVADEPLTEQAHAEQAELPAEDAAPAE